MQNECKTLPLNKLRYEKERDYDRKRKHRISKGAKTVKQEQRGQRKGEFIRQEDNQAESSQSQHCRRRLSVQKIPNRQNFPKAQTSFHLWYQLQWLQRLCAPLLKWRAELMRQTFNVRLLAKSEHQSETNFFLFFFVMYFWQSSEKSLKSQLITAETAPQPQFRPHFLHTWLSRKSLSAKSLPTPQLPK